MAQKYSTLLRWINVVVDYSLLNGILCGSFFIAGIDVDWWNVYDSRLTILLLNFCWFFSTSISYDHSYMLKHKAALIINATIGSLLVFTTLAALLKYALPHLYVPPTPYLYFFILFPAFILSIRCFLLLLRKHRRRFWPGYRSIVIVGAGSGGIDLYNHIVSNPQLDLNYQIKGIFDDDNSKMPPHINYLGPVEECIHYACANNVDEVYCALSYSDSKKIEKLMQEADKNMIRFRLVPDVKGSIQRNFLVELFGYVPVLKARQEPLENKANEIIKRLFDIVFSLSVIIFILSWFIPIVALAIKLDSKGPVFFRQLRSGKNNKPFYCLKFRSMKVNSTSDSVQASKDDLRVTKLGKFIRKTSIDELPQFINVLLGNMSVVGPRPHMLKHTHDYSQFIDNYMVRHFLTPGITGWAQVNGFRGETKETTSMINRVQADLWYLENWSVLLDMKIIFLTFWQSLKKNDNVY
ncbi:undecaprenyl-phosphate glucose phosphotransferase [Pontibacter sp. SGAir0037]|uniref:undecaprenyl-phosphate glucose phosphotransferase n=1 Tax=Pontibacter sp. SGAir0037 TaxID=2571030 RepID=UPI0010CD3835|nr:undecaprenyl-phosphate glucose phosphotransferase [Pontibacter sp. SGAir0037]QCR22608.1 undecaprenyl-phosphate glucose phosphotransferase [Pontibacter sp. SGAir0037]